MKTLLSTGIILVLLGLAAGFGPQLVTAIRTGLPSNGILWLQPTGFVIAAIGAVLIGSYIGKRRSARRAQRNDGHSVG
ncbi:MAG: hypothetical protein EPN48_17360 [Microbacteriaceae bacterium]|nr:MAG: hypothetical protein EPN48_17360 [Microbacteriaceae bacterium]